jgi:hypothetical protein
MNPEEIEHSTREANLENFGLTAHENEIRKLKVYVDQAFTDNQRAKILHAINLIPDCQRPKLNGLHIYSRSDMLKQGEQCVAGRYYVGRNRLELFPKCNGVQVGITLHEIYHHLGVNRNQHLHQQYRPTFNKFPRCPVSKYALQAKILEEDFAEAGRILTLPISGDSYSGNCVSEKLDNLHQLLDRCD